MYTVYNEEENRFELVEEPDPSLRYTYADYLKWKFEEQVELIKGRIVKMSPAPNTKHQIIAGNLFVLMKNFLKKQKCQVFIAPFDVRLPKKNKIRDSEITTVVQPDLCIVCDESKIDQKGCLGSPDLVMEVLSTGNTKKEVKLKYELYEESGVKEYWLVYPAEENIAVFILNPEGRYDGAKIYAGRDLIYSSAIKGFVVKLSEVFTK